MKTIKGSLGYLGFGVSANISKGQQSLGPQIEEWETGIGGTDTMILSDSCCITFCTVQQLWS